ncbi:MAG: hypothetical protein ACRYGM_20080 [Janthinobacterium lividum]
MRWFGTAWSEFIGLFVDDGSFALAIVAWLLLAWLVLPRLPLPPAWPPIILFAGLAAILIESAVRRSRTRP